MNALRNDEPKVFIIYETDPSGKAPQSVRRLDAILTGLGWQVGTDYRYECDISGADKQGVSWALALWGILPLYDVAILLRAPDRSNRSREYRGVDWELETLALHHRPVLTYASNLLENLSDAEADEIGREINHYLLVAMVFGGRGVQLPDADEAAGGMKRGTGLLLSIRNLICRLTGHKQKKSG